MAEAAKISVAIEAVTGEALAELSKLSANIKDFAAQATRDMGEMQRSLTLSTVAHSIGHVKDALAFLSRQIKDCVGAAMNWEQSVNGLSRTLGVSTKEAGGLANALGRLGADAGAYRGAVFNLQQALRGQEDAFKANGIATRDANGEMLNIQQVMMNALGRLREMKPGYDANALATLAFGRSAKDLGGMLNLTNEAIADGAEKVNALGIEVGAGDTAAQAYKAAMADVNDTLEALKIRMGQELMPAVAQLAQTFAGIANAVAPALAACFKTLAAVTDHWKTALAALLVVLANKLKVAMVELFTTVIPKLIAGVQGFVTSLGPIGIAMAVVAAAVAVWDQVANAAGRAAKSAAEYAKAKAEAFITEGGLLRQYAADLRTLVEQMAKEEAANGRATEAQEAHKDALVAAIRALGNAGSNYAGTLYICSAAQIQQLGSIDKMLEAQKKETESKLAAAEAELKGLSKTTEGYAEKAEEVKKLRAEMIAFTGDAVKAAAAFVAPGAGGGAKPYTPKPLTNPMPEMPSPAVGLQDLQDLLAAQEAARKAADARSRDLGLLALERERDLADHKVAMGQMTAERRLEIERDFIERENQLRLVGAEDAEIAAAEGVNRTLANMLGLTEAHTEKWRGLWADLGASIKESLGDAFKGLVNGTQSWGDATKGILKTVEQGFIDMAAKELTSFITKENAMTAVKAVATGARTALAWAGSVAEGAASIAAAMKSMLASAWAAAAAAFKAMVGIPYVGPALAVGAGAAALAAVMAMTGNLPSAAGGYYDVPRDQLAMIHKQEMVLPAAHSQRLRSLIEGGEDGGGLGNGGGTVNVTINAADSVSVARLFRNNGTALVKALKDQARNFAFQS